MDEIKVSVICNAFNHEKYITDALEGFIKQKTNFKFEVLVHDDASTDRTAEIIKEYEKKYPDIIKPIYQTENQYSKRVKINTVYNYPRAKGKYFAFCEGDDYWTDKNKLQKQYNYMEKHSEVDMCAHKAVAVKSSTGEIEFYFPEIKEDTLFKTEEVIDTYFSTNSLFCKAETLTNPAEFRKQLTLDYTMQLQGALKGGIYCFADCMSVYRCMTDNSWTRKMQNNKELLIKNEMKIINMLNTFNKETDYKYDTKVQSRINKYKIHILELKEEYKEILKNYREEVKKKPRKEKMKLCFKAYFPFVNKLYKRIKDR